MGRERNGQVPIVLTTREAAVRFGFRFDSGKFILAVDNY